MTMFSRLMWVAGLTAALLLGADSVMEQKPWQTLEAPSSDPA